MLNIVDNTDYSCTDAYIAAVTGVDDDGEPVCIIFSRPTPTRCDIKVAHPDPGTGLNEPLA